MVRNIMNAVVKVPFLNAIGEDVDGQCMEMVERCRDPEVEDSPELGESMRVVEVGKRVA